MDRLFKFLNKRNKKERLLLIATLDSVVSRRTKDLDIRKLKGGDNQFRVRVGKFRILFKKDGARNIVIKIDERNDRTYK